ncbi:myb-related protein 2-like isoform X1 [Vitis riparia]|uniref:myb-related protein 2-like isoform X1 n=1 Tax=Vitis riparia TaxID=96939 RepID=UPI00155A8907|nr:myb-related protein 2-like isoform X1 [Vitis riparia]
MNQNRRHNQGNTGPVLLADSKPRLKWTPELHERFMEAVNQLGGAYKATPKTIMKQMGIQGITLNHIKSHLQKYRMSEHFLGQASTENTRNVTGDTRFEANGESIYKIPLGSHTNKSLQKSTALQMLIEVPRRSHEQLEVQQHLQVQVESQEKYSHAIFKGVHRTLGRENPSLEGGKGARDQPSRLVFKIPDRYQDALHPKFTELPGLCAEETQMNHFPNFSKNSCPTLFEEYQSDKKMNHNIVHLEAYHHDVPLAPKDVGKWRTSD